MRTRQVAIGIVAGWISLGSLAATAATAATAAGAEGGPGLDRLPALQASEAFLSQNRVKVTVNYRNQYSGETGAATAVPQGDEFAYFAFTSASSASNPTALNPDVVVKVLGNNDPNWFQLFAAGLTDFEFTVTFAGCGQVRTFTQPAGGDVKYADGRGIRSAGCAPWTNEVTVTLPGGVPLALERIPSGTFQMGSPATERSWEEAMRGFTM